MIPHPLMPIIKKSEVVLRGQPNICDAKRADAGDMWHFICRRCSLPSVALNYFPSEMMRFQIPEAPGYISATKSRVILSPGEKLQSWYVTWAEPLPTTKGTLPLPYTFHFN